MKTSPKSRPQISIALMILVMSIFAVMSAGMFYASRVGAIQDELSVIAGGSSSAAEPSRTAHLAFLMFTYTSPLLLAMLLGTIVSVTRFMNRPTITRRVTSPPL
jgi:predicted permease